jgi:LmbE family N-acetylglucosaminyl deacetylase
MTTAACVGTAMIAAVRPRGILHDVRSVLAVVAHPDDESFGLGAVLDLLAAVGAGVAVVCFTRGEASTFRADPGDLATVRPAEFTAAARVLGVTATRLLGYPDGGLSAVPLYELAVQVREMALEVAASHLVTFDVGGVTGHPDHARATGAAPGSRIAAGLACPRLDAARDRGRRAERRVRHGLHRTEDRRDRAFAQSRPGQAGARDRVPPQSVSREPRSVAPPGVARRHGAPAGAAAIGIRSGGPP